MPELQQHQILSAPGLGIEPAHLQPPEPVLLHSLLPVPQQELLMLRPEVREPCLTSQSPHNDCGRCSDHWASLLPFYRKETEVSKMLVTCPK